MRRFLLIVGALAAGAAAPSLSAQSPHGKATVISLQPLSALAAVYAAEIERTVNAKWTVGVGGTYWSPEFGGQDMRYTSGDVKVRYYPQAAALRGFAIGLLAGYSHIRDRSTTVIIGTNPENERTVAGPTFGASLDYNLLLGKSRSFYVGIGVGGKRIAARTENVSDDVKFAYPTARLSIGRAF